MALLVNQSFFEQGGNDGLYDVEVFNTYKSCMVVDIASFKGVSIRCMMRYLHVASQQIVLEVLLGFHLLQFKLMGNFSTEKISEILERARDMLCQLIF